MYVVSAERVRVQNSIYKPYQQSEWRRRISASLEESDSSYMYIVSAERVRVQNSIYKPYQQSEWRRRISASLEEVRQQRRQAERVRVQNSIYKPYQQSEWRRRISASLEEVRQQRRQAERVRVQNSIYKPYQQSEWRRRISASLEEVRQQRRQGNLQTGQQKETSPANDDAFVRYRETEKIMFSSILKKYDPNQNIVDKNKVSPKPRKTLRFMVPDKALDEDSCDSAEEFKRLEDDLADKFKANVNIASPQEELSLNTSSFFVPLSSQDTGISFLSENVPKQHNGIGPYANRDNVWPSTTEPPDAHVPWGCSHPADGTAKDMDTKLTLEDHADTVFKDSPPKQDQMNGCSDSFMDIASSPEDSTFFLPNPPSVTLGESVDCASKAKGPFDDNESILASSQDLNTTIGFVMQCSDSPTLTTPVKSTEERTPPIMAQAHVGSTARNLRNAAIANLLGATTPGRTAGPAMFVSPVPRKMIGNRMTPVAGASHTLGPDLRVADTLPACTLPAPTATPLSLMDRTTALRLGASCPRSNTKHSSPTEAAILRSARKAAARRGSIEHFSDDECDKIGADCRLSILTDFNDTNMTMDQDFHLISPITVSQPRQVVTSSTTTPNSTLGYMCDEEIQYWLKYSPLINRQDRVPNPVAKYLVEGDDVTFRPINYSPHQRPSSTH